MNLVLDFLDRHRTRLARIEPRVQEELACILLTPHFRASRHVVFLLVHRETGVPQLVAKVARLEGGADWSRHEEANLRAAHAGANDELGSVPRAVACEEHRGHAILLETALPGVALDPAAIRSKFEPRVRAVVDWLVDFQRTQPRMQDGARAIDARLDSASAMLRSAAGSLFDREIEQTRRLAVPLGDGVPCVFEHGDLSHPNLLELTTGGIGVLDWETAEPAGLPASDLFFFLTYAAIARARATDLEAQLRTFHETFFAPTHWVQAACARYAAGLAIDPALLRPLFAVCWLRCAASFAERLDAAEQDGDSNSETARWILEHRYTAMWRHTLDHWNELNL